MSDDALLEALKLNDQHVRGVTRLDQQFIYVPLGLLAGVVHELVARPGVLSTKFEAIGYSGAVLVLFLVPLFVFAGLERNQARHEELLKDRADLRTRLNIPPETREATQLSEGRRIYFFLFLLGWVTGGALLLAYL